ncbi:hypothetical protein GCM10025868_16900 [Angustibacter aerolatus]|uniref:2-C-methyl-D-erythritol 4-phosphate cytidylyltransferase n=1 Tax=Angustibacter aerolatus TaxID=1162965 RepID=A0ABQ6JHY4_9ACTN|nr:hypothetical protein GCM10025868_16900 [Angustibacter aerolatus]
MSARAWASTSPSRLIKIAGRPIIEHTIAILQASPLVDEIVVMMTPGYLDEVHAVVRRGGYAKVTKVLEGAGTRNGTTARALAALGEDECNVLFHDAVRPLLSQRIVADCVAALERYDAVDTAIPSADTIIQVGAGDGPETIDDVLPRSLLRRGQTPQAFRLSVIRRAYEWRRPTPTSWPPTTAPSCCATCPTCRSPWSPATSAT